MMPAWCGIRRRRRKSHKTTTTKGGGVGGGAQQLTTPSSIIKNIIDDDDEKKTTTTTTTATNHMKKKKSSIEEEKEETQNSPRRTSKDFMTQQLPSSTSSSSASSTTFVGFSGWSSSSGSGSGSGFDSDFDKRGGGVGHPLPRPSVSSSSSSSSSAPPSLVHEHGGLVVLGSGSVSVSSFSSSASASSSSEDQQPSSGFVSVLHNHRYKGHGETKFSPRSTSPCSGSRTSISTSPLNPRPCGAIIMSPESSIRKQEDGKSTLCHPLPLPPGSPSKSCAPIIRSNENSHYLQSGWKKGRLLGRGTFGHVYLGFNSESGQMCAIKEVKVISDDQTSKECLRQLNQEIALLGQLSHPNIVQYYGSDLGEETLSVYLEYVSGGSIHKLLQEYGPFKEPVIQNYTKQILLGLAYLHGRKTVHRDIKGANILVDPNGEIKLADFGMAKHITAYSSMLSFKGSPYWMAPEVIMNSGGYSLAVDIWSLGCTILEMATSKPPWSHYEGVAAIFKVGNSRDIPEIPDHLSDNAKEFLKLCLQREPSTRPTAAQLLDHPFIRDETATPVLKMNMIIDVSPSTDGDGSQAPTSSHFPSNKASIISGTRDHNMKSTMVTSLEPLKNSRDITRLNMSLPVSLCSSPLRQYEPKYKRCFLSPPHPSHILVGQNDNAGLSNSPVMPKNQYMNYLADPWLDNHGSPRT